MDKHELKVSASPTSKSRANRGSVVASVSVWCAAIGFMGSALFDYIMLGVAPHEELVRHEFSMLWYPAWLITNLVLLVGCILGGAALSRSGGKRGYLGLVPCAVLLVANAVVYTLADRSGAFMW